MAISAPGGAGSLWRRALWNMRWPAVFICGPILGLVMVNLFFGLPAHLWLVAVGFLALVLVLFVILVRGEVQRLRRMPRSNPNG